MPWLEYGPLLSIVLGYLVFLFGVAWAAERSRWLGRSPRLQTATYVLTASVYCTAWTFYGSVGLAAHRGVEFLTIYLGPALLALLWPVFLRRLVRVAKEQRITSISDFVSSRYGKSAPLGALVAVVVVLGLIPYIALQLQAVSQSFKLILRQETILDLFDPTLLVAVVLGLFGILFGARNPDFTQVQRGLLSAVAVESVVKLLAFLTVGAYVTWGLFGGFGDLFGRALADPELSRLVTLGPPPATPFTRWATLLLISMAAVLFLPRQFHVLVVQNQDERHVAAASWMFPLYLLLINVFVLPIAIAGLLLLPRTDADHYVLLLPLASGNQALSILVFLGGFSAATAMIVVDSLALSKMITNDLVVPVLLRNRSRDVYRASRRSMRLSILLVVFLGYVWALMARGQFLLVEMGLLSFVAVAQCAPAIVLGLAWSRGNRRGAATGITGGFLLWLYTLIVPALVKEGFLDGALLTDGPFGLAALRPTALLGLGDLDPVTHGVFWSLLVNLVGYVFVSLATRQDAEERLQAAAFTGRFPGEGDGPVRRTTLSPREVEGVLQHYVGGAEGAAIAREVLGRQAGDLTPPELLELRIRLEQRLAASLGAAAARFIVEDGFTLSRGEAERLVESFQELRQSLRTTEEEARRTERLLASVVRSVDDCIFTTDTEGRMVTINPAGQRLLGAREADLAGALWWDVLGARPPRLAGSGPRGPGAWRGWKGETRARTRAGRDFPAHLALTPIVDRQARVLGMVGVLRDLTEQHEMQRRLIHQEKLASLGQMAAGVAHEIRNPLGGIKMAVGLLSSHDGRAAALSREMLETVRSGIRQIESIVSTLLDYTREARLDRQPYDLGEIARQVVRGLAETAAARGVTLSCDTVPQVMVAVVDGQKIRQVIINLVENALEAADRRPGAVVEVRGEVHDGKIALEVTDTGLGMVAEARDRMFLPFFTTKPTGTGLGLAIVKKIVDLHGGEIHVDSAPGRGTRIRVALPAGGMHEAASADRRG